jgi:hypothetical protein
MGGFRRGAAYAFFKVRCHYPIVFWACQMCELFFQATQNHSLDVLPNAALLLRREVDGHLTAVYFHMDSRLLFILAWILLFQYLLPPLHSAYEKQKTPKRLASALAFICVPLFQLAAYS